MNTHSAQPANNRTLTVWDPLVRIFHWSLVICFVIAFATEDDWLYLHSFAGYTIVGLLLFRICWGLIGTRYARFSSFVAGPTGVKRYLKSLFSRHPEHHIGHNPAGGAMILLMMLLLLAVSFSGMATLATEGLGPLAGTFVAGWSEDWLEEIHEALANLMLLMVVVHVAGVVVSSLLHHENLIRAMIDGRKRQPKEPQS
ncbi:cytochrome b/b6 domain-containing protein [Motiliproteus sediminis]|uniref:cytochrome b/b6 domain-containing protein n=1 Tax=Motiliproteus sediminis TaxID=1468178 RepID=UPI001AEFC05F|nr:cytochrome b/b6 domain-containing protein [Motiliproteus sediminis]